MDNWIIVISTCLSFVITAVGGFAFIPLLRRLRFGQSIREDGPVWHEKKQGTPTMGGIMFILGVAAAVPFAVYKAADASEKMGILFCCVTALLYGMIGFADDLVKVLKKQNLGLTASQKLILQFGVAIAFTVSMKLSGILTETIDIPFTALSLNIGFVMHPLCVLAMVGITNAVNITDGLDGLAASVSWVVGILLLLAFSLFRFSGYSIIAAGFAASMLGFLVWNFYPAKVFMGDTGSLFIGGLVGALFFAMRQPLLFVIAGIAYMIDIISVVIQVLHYKRTKRRVFLMAPIHHHYEKKGWSEIKIVLAAIIITVVFCAGAYVWLYFVKA